MILILDGNGGRNVNLLYFKYDDFKILEKLFKISTQILMVKSNAWNDKKHYLVESRLAHQILSEN